MKRVFSIGLLLLFAWTYITPYMPYIDYFLNKEYIAQELCENKEKPALKCHGQCHLKKEIEKTIEKEKEAPISPTSNKEKESKQSLNLFVKGKETLYLYCAKSTNHFGYTEMHSSFIQKSFIPPPQV